MQTQALSSEYPESCAASSCTVSPPPFKLLKTLPPVPLFYEDSKTSSVPSTRTSTKASTKTSSKLQSKKRAPNASGKRLVQPNWLSEATSAKQKVESDAALAHKTLLNGGVAEETWVRDLGGVYNNKVDGTWYTLDCNGGNPSPVCGQPYADPYFEGVRTWETLEERSQAILSHQSLLEMADM